ncbi:hypothetical protein [Vibrio agarivorans]|uniref:Uncharacterized protein n=1 Tax=Vibrio agarivorans TaxID=153622 RepID=A0ABT7Y762_9VIBR|nr:hypothetical protein [Vibrio agarivorans]MDN2483896.1 hypothetical protein [Vibrio agarivorans]
MRKFLGLALAIASLPVFSSEGQLAQPTFNQYAVQIELPSIMHAFTIIPEVIIFPHVEDISGEVVVVQEAKVLSPAYVISEVSQPDLGYKLSGVGSETGFVMKVGYESCSDHVTIDFTQGGSYDICGGSIKVAKID